MPASVWIGDDGLVHADLSGLVALETFLEQLQSTLDSPEFRPGMSILVDARSAAHHMGSADMARVARLLAVNQLRIAGGRGAIVVSQTVTYGMMRMLQARVDSMPFAFSVFYDLQEALAWLGMAPRTYGAAGVPID